MPNYVVSHNTFINEKVIELFPTEFHVIVSSQTLDLFSYLLLDHRFPLLKLSKEIILLFQNIYPNLYKVIINESQHISSTTMWYKRRKALKIGMDVIQSTFSSMNTYIEFHLALFLKHTMLTKI